MLRGLITTMSTKPPTQRQHLSELSGLTFCKTASAPLPGASHALNYLHHISYMHECATTSDFVFKTKYNVFGILWAYIHCFAITKVNIFRGELIDISADTKSLLLTVSASVFNFVLNVFLDTLIQKIFFYIIKIIIFRGELTDISAKKEALLTVCRIVDLTINTRVQKGSTSHS